MPVLIKPEAEMKQESPSGDMIIRPLRWGLVPAFTKADSVKEACRVSNLMINARFHEIMNLSTFHFEQSLKHVQTSSGWTTCDAYTDAC